MPRASSQAHRTVRAAAVAAVCWSIWAFLAAGTPARGQNAGTEAGAPNAAAPMVLIVNSYHPGFTFSDNEMAGIRSTFARERPDAIIFDEYLDTKRFPDLGHFDEEALLIAAKYGRRPPNLVMTTDDAALQFALRNRATLFPGIPIVFCGVNGFTSTTLAGHTGVTGVLEVLDPSGTLDVILQIQPATREVAVLHDTTVTGMLTWRQTQAIMPRYAGRLTFAELPNEPFPEILKRVARLGEGSVLLVLSYALDSTGRAFTPLETDVPLAKACPVPIYTVVDSHLNGYTMGGRVLTGEGHGEHAARVALRVLAGEDASAIPVDEGTSSRLIFDYRRLERFGISPARLPAASELINRPGTFVERHPTLIAAACVFLAGLILTVFVMAIDIVKRRRVEQQLRASEERFQKAFRSSPLTMIVSTPYEGRLLEVSDRFQDMLGYTREEVVGRTVMDLSLWAYPEERGDYVRDLMARGGLMHREAVWRRKDGRLVSVVCSADVIELEGEERVLSTVADVTGLRRAEAALRLTQAALDASSDCAFVALKDGRFVYVNQTACHVLGYSREDFLERLTVSDIIADLAASDWPNRWARLSVLGTSIGEYGLLVKDGGAIPVEASLRMLEFDGQPCLFALARSLTERKRAEEERHKIDLQIQQAQKLESLGVLAGGIAHDFNNLLTGVLGNADLALLELSPVSPAREYVEQIETGARRAAELTRQMLAYSGRGRFVIETIQLSDIVEEMAHLLEVSISKKCILKYHFAPNLPPVSADVAQLRQIVMNLIINASEAIGERSGVIAVTTGAMECDRAYLAESYLDDNLEPGLYVYLEVADTGVGMAREVCQRIFDPFFTTKFTGRGLGLAAVLGIVRGHRGAIKVYSEPGRGTTFKVLLPPSLEPVADGPARITVPPLSGSGLILVVDDEETVRSLVRNYLVHAGFEVLTASDGREAVGIFAQVASRVRLVLLDLTMPHMNGEETYTELRRIRPDIRVVLMSGYNEQEATSRFAGKHLAGFIQKPFRMDEFTLVIRPCLEAEEEDSRRAT